MSTEVQNPARSGPRGIEPGAAATHSGGDERFHMLDASMKRHRYQHDALIEVLHSAQELFGYLRDDLLQYVARGLRLPPSRVYGVATFYHLFTFVPRGRHACTICTGTACYVKGADAVVAAVTRMAGIQPGQTTPDGALSLETARCLGACGLAPVAVFDGEVAAKLTPEQALNHITEWAADGHR